MNKKLRRATLEDRNAGRVLDQFLETFPPEDDDPLPARYFIRARTETAYQVDTANPDSELRTETKHELIHKDGRGYVIGSSPGKALLRFQRIMAGKKLKQRKLPEEDL